MEKFRVVVSWVPFEAFQAHKRDRLLVRRSSDKRVLSRDLFFGNYIAVFDVVECALKIEKH